MPGVAGSGVIATTERNNNWCGSDTARRTAREALGRAPVAVVTALDEAIEGLAHAADDLRELARGIHPALLTQGGLEPALTMVAKRCLTPVSVEIACDERFPEAVEIAAYFLVSEALTNIGRHARAAHANLIVRRNDGTLIVEVIDDGLGHIDLGVSPPCLTRSLSGRDLPAAGPSSRRANGLSIEERDDGEHAAVIVRSLRERQLAEDAPHMFMDGSLADPQLAGDTSVRSALGHELENLALTGREVTQGILDSARGDELGDQPGVDDRTAVGDPLERLKEVPDVSDPALQQVADAAPSGE
jgi:anti-sigma regulatory factor (Ser/Thr protein kinase)